jgi:hypothetical protein
MQKRQRDLTTMVETAELEILRCYTAKSRLCADVRAPNGVESTFPLSNGSRQDVRGDLNELARMKRFSRANPSAVLTPAIQIPVRRRVVKLVPDAATTPPAPISIAEPAITMTKPTPPVAPAKTAPMQDLSPTQFYLLCIWLKALDLKLLPSFEAFAMVASQKFAMPVSEVTLKEALKATEIAEPEHWSPTTVPHLIVAFELVAFMKSLGTEPPASLVSMLKPSTVAAAPTP